LKNKRILLSLFVLTSFINCHICAQTLLDDGETHYISDMVLEGEVFPLSTPLIVDYLAPDAGTVVNIEGYFQDIDGIDDIETYGQCTLILVDFAQSIACWVNSHENSTINFQSGFYPVFDAYDNSTVVFNGGLTEGLDAYNDSKIFLNAGGEGEFRLFDNSELIMTGGSTIHIETNDSSHVEIWGGELNSGMAFNSSIDIFVLSYNYDPVSDSFTGVLSDGTPFDITVSSLNANVVVVSEIPTVSQWGLIAMTILLLSTGAIAIKRRRHRPSII